MSESLSQKYYRILDLLGHDSVGKKSGCYTQIRCPIPGAHKHDDKSFSASLGLHNDGISFKCFTGCQTDDFLKALNLTYKDLYPDSDRIPTNTYTYHNEDGSYHHDKVKFKNPDGTKDFYQRVCEENGRIVRRVEEHIPYHYPEVRFALKNDSLIGYFEGEKDCETAKVLGFTATTMGGASDWKDDYKNFFKGAKIVLVPDKDDKGLQFTARQIESLKTVCKSVKTLILPAGKDLTEWVEAGNHDLKPLIESATELVTTNGVPEPIVKPIVGGYELYWLTYNLKITIDRISENEIAEIAVFENGKQVYNSEYKLLSVSHKNALLTALIKINPNHKWAIIVNQITTQVVSRLRNNDPVIVLDESYGKTKPNLIIDPLFVENDPNIIYGERSSAKSLCMIMVAIFLKYGLCFNDAGLSTNHEHDVLWLDFENNPNSTGWQLQSLAKGIGLVDVSIPYARISRPFYKSLPEIQKKVSEVNASVVFIDSLGPAVGGDLNATEPALNFFNALRQIPYITPIILAHTSKDLNNKRKTVYGNAYYENMARSIWEFNKYQLDGAGELILTMFQRKCPPFLGLHSPMALKFKFDNDKTFVESCEPRQDNRNEN